MADFKFGWIFTEKARSIQHFLTLCIILAKYCTEMWTSLKMIHMLYIQGQSHEIIISTKYTELCAYKLVLIIIDLMLTTHIEVD